MTQATWEMAVRTRSIKIAVAWEDDGTKEEDHEDGSSMEDDGTKGEDHEDGSSVEDDGTKEEDHEDGSSMEDDGTKEEDHEDGSSVEDDGTKEVDHEDFGSMEENHEDGGSMIDDDNADDTSVNKEEANENGGRDVKEHTDMKRNPNKINSCLDAEIDVIAREHANAKLLAHHFAKTTIEMPVLCKVTELFIHCHTCMYMQLILICSICIWSSFPILLSNTIQGCRIIFIRYCRRCINTVINLGNHCNNFTSHLVKHTPKINLINAQITCIICMPHA